jgi:hypothetical protein
MYCLTDQPLHRRDVAPGVLPQSPEHILDGFVDFARPRGAR